jgi:hypothetical protein
MCCYIIQRLTTEVCQITNKEPPFPSRRKSLYTKCFVSKCSKFRSLFSLTEMAFLDCTKLFLLYEEMQFCRGAWLWWQGITIRYASAVCKGSMGTRTFHTILHPTFVFVYCRKSQLLVLIWKPNLSTSRCLCNMPQYKSQSYSRKKDQ